MSSHDSNSDDEQSVSSHQSSASSLTQNSQDTAVSLGEQNRRQAASLKKLKKKLKELQSSAITSRSRSPSPPLSLSKRAKTEKRKSQSGSSTLQLNLAPKPKVLEIKNGKITADMVQTHGNSLLSWSVGNNGTFNRDALANLYSAEVQGIIYARYKQYLTRLDEPPNPTAYEQDFFNLDMENHVRILFELFPHSMEKDTLSIIRHSKDFRDNWFTTEDPMASIETFLTRLFGQRLNMLKSGRYPEENGTVCTDEEFPALRTAILAKILPSPTLSEADAKSNKKQSIFLTNRMLVDTIKQDLPENLMALYNAILQVATSIVTHREIANKLHWLKENTHHHHHDDSVSSKPWKNKGDRSKDHKKRKSNSDDKDDPPKKKPTEDKDAPSSSSSSAHVSTYRGKNPKPKCEKCHGHHDKDVKCPKKSQHTWNNKNKKPQTKETNEGINDNKILFNELLIDTDIVSYLIPSKIPPVSEQEVHTPCTDSVNINITPSDIDLLHNIFDDTEKSTPGTVPVIVVSQTPSIVNTLIDSGSLKSNYVDISLFDRLKSQGVKTIPLPKRRRVCSGLAGVECQEINEYMELLIVFINECNNKEESIIIQVHPIHMRGPFSLIIGLPSIQTHRLAKKFKSVFENKKYNHMKYFRPLSEFRSGDNLSGGQGQSYLTNEDILASTDPIREDTQERMSLASSTVPAQPDRPVPTKNSVSHDLDDNQETVQTRYEKSTDHMIPEQPTSSGVMSSDELYLLAQTFGPPSLQKKLKKLLKKYKHIFSISVSPTPAKVEAPMEIKINSSQWYSKQNRSPARTQSHQKQLELRKHVQAMLDNNVIRPSTAKAWSQVLLVPKPDNTMRLCIDFRNLNATTEPSEAHPLPRIDHMLRRLGDKKAKFYGVLDLTAGYHQVPLAEEAIPLTAFLCFMGLYEFLRVPMGLVNAASFFQRFIAITVLAGLMYVIVEAYIDDVIIHGQEEDDFVQNVAAVFQRFDEHGVKVNPKKVKLGLPNIEYVGHVIDHEGLTFSRSKLDSVYNFNQPIYAAQMKSFLGLANYFRDHIRNYSELARPLQDMIGMTPYNRRNKLQWTVETMNAFNILKTKIHECPKLFFVDHTSPIHLFTDASDYGIGAYLCQIINGREVPIAFISKTLDKKQRDWSTPEKECYAIYYAFTKFEHLLLDREFIVHTDHVNLTFLKESTNARVKRWKLALQEYRYTIEFIKGIDNIIADSFSRLCLLDEETHNLSEEEILSAFDEIVDDTDDQINTINSKALSYPQEYKDIMSQCHNSQVGHFGVEKTVNLILDKGFRWPYLRQHVKSFIKKCPCCQMMSQIKPAIHTRPFTTSTYNPMESLNMDTMGPLPPDEDGNTAILVIIDRFSRWIELIPAKDTTAKSAALALLKHIGRYGTPAQLLSDGGSQYVNTIISELLTLIGIEHEITIAYSKEENSIVERSNKEVLRHLRNIIFEKHILSSWSHYLPLVQRIINSSVHSALGVSPAQILFGNVIDLDRSLFPTAKEFSISYANLSLSKFASDLIVAQDIIIKKAQEHQLEKNEKHMHERYMKHEKFAKHHKSVTQKESMTDKSSNSKAQTVSTPETVFEVNSYVLLAYPDTGFTKRARPPHKLMCEWKGPYKVISHIGTNYTLLNMVTMKEESNIHVVRLKHFEYEEGSDPRLVANQASQNWDVEKILSHTGKPFDSKRNDTKKTMTFKVKWVGFDETTDEPYTNRSLFKTAAMHDYLRENNLKSLIPAAYK